MKNRTFRIVCFFLLLSSELLAQDIHWSQFNEIPLFQNPGNTGLFRGDYRFMMNYKDQWRSVSVPFTTFSCSADMKLKRLPKLGLGFLFFNDAAGDGVFRTIELQANVAYSIKLTSDSVHLIRGGLNVGINHRQINWDKLTFDNQYNGIVFDPNLPANEFYQTDRKTNYSIGLGVVYTYAMSKEKRLTAGLGFFNLNRPNQGFFNQKVERDVRTNIFIKANYKLDVDIDLLPSINLSFQGVYREIIIGSSLKYTLIDNVKDYRAFYGGIWYRSRDAAYLTIGMDYQNWFFGLSYDFNFSKLTPASGARGGFEFATRYILNYFKPKKIMHRICPDFI